MAYRSHMKKSRDRKVFRRTAIKTAEINNRMNIPRGGIRL